MEAQAQGLDRRGNRRYHGRRGRRHARNDRRGRHRSRDGLGAGAPMVTPDDGSSPAEAETRRNRRSLAPCLRWKSQAESCRAGFAGSQEIFSIARAQPEDSPASLADSNPSMSWLSRRPLALAEGVVVLGLAVSVEPAGVDAVASVLLSDEAASGAVVSVHRRAIGL